MLNFRIIILKKKTNKHPNTTYCSITIIFLVYTNIANFFPHNNIYTFNVLMIHKMYQHSCGFYSIYYCKNFIINFLYLHQLCPTWNLLCNSCTYVFHNIATFQAIEFSCLVFIHLVCPLNSVYLKIDWVDM